RAHCAAALANGFDPEDWTVFRAFAADYAARQQAHLEIEETTLLPIADELLAPEEDQRLAALFPRFDSAA
ncbi:MAG: hemerythrin domain-containing protein, partial [Rhodospirillales bacterium]|nr:hemerythrin domain-containing protein [Rhodospirillales bacterium]